MIPSTLSDYISDNESVSIYIVSCLTNTAVFVPCSKTLKLALQRASRIVLSGLVLTLSLALTLIDDLIVLLALGSNYHHNTYVILPDVTSSSKTYR
jgi:hypothetical protein